MDKRRSAAIAKQLDDLIDDDEFWRFQARSLAIFAMPENLRAFRGAPEPMVTVFDRFHMKPLLRSFSFPQSCYVLGEIGYWPSGRFQAAEGRKVLLRQFPRNVGKALRPLLNGSGIPLLLAAAEPVASIYRSATTNFGSHQTNGQSSGMH